MLPVTAGILGSPNNDTNIPKNIKLWDSFRNS